MTVTVTNSDRLPRIPAAKAGEGATFRPKFILIPQSVYSDPHLSHAAKLLYGRLKLYAGKNGHCWPKHETLARELCLGERQVRRTLDQLRDAGWISWDRWPTSNLYTVHTDRQETATPDRTKMSTPEPEIGQKCPVRLDKNGHSRLDKNVLHKRSIEKRNLKRPPSPSEEGEVGLNIENQQFALQPTPVREVNGKPHSANHAQNGNGRLAPKEAIQRVAGQIHERHPNAHGRRDCSAAAVEKKLAAILKHQRIPVHGQDAYLERIDRNHSAWCSSTQWQKNNGEFAKSLENWLAPSVGRYLNAPAAAPVNGSGQPYTYTPPPDLLTDDQIAAERARKRAQMETRSA